MKICGWRIHGFGVFRDYELGGLSPGLNVFWGPNEAGKTTLLAFLRGMFFGFPPGERGKAYYPPARGRRHGGIIELEIAPDDVLTVERNLRKRHPLKITFANGRRGNEGDLRRLLGGIDERLFRSVFAFSLTELQAFESLSDQAVQEHLYSATLAGEGRAARRAILALYEEAERRLPVEGDSKISELGRELDAIEQRLAREATVLERYPELLREEHDLGRTIEDLDRAAGEERAAIARLGDFLALWPVFAEVAELSRRIDGLATVTGVPRDCAARHAALREKLRSARAEIEGIGRERDRRHAERDDLSARLDDRLFDGSARVPALAEALGVHRQTLEGLARAEDELARAEKATRAATDVVLGTTGTISAFEATTGLALELSQLAREVERTSAEQEQTRRLFGLQASEVRRLTVLRDELRAQSSAIEPPLLEEIDRRDAAARQIRAGLAELRGEEAALDLAETQESALARDLADLDAQRSRVPSLLPSVLALGAGMGAVAAAVWELSLEHVPGLVFFGLVAIACLAAAVLHASWRRRTGAEAKRVKKASERRRSEREEARRRLGEIRERIATLRRSLDENGRALGIAGAITYGAIEDRVAELGRLRDARHSWTERERRTDEITRELAEARADEDRLASELARANEAAKCARDAWRARIDSAGLDPRIDPSSLPEVLRGVEAARERIAAECRAREAVDLLREQAARWEDPARSILSDAGFAAARDSSSNDLIGHFLELRRRVDDDLALRSRVARIDERLGEAGEREEAAALEVGRAEAAIESLYREVGASDESEFFDRLNAHETRSRLEERRAEKANELAARLETLEDSDAVREALASGSPDAWRVDVAKREEHLARIRTERDEALRRRGETERARRDLESSSRTAALELERESLRTELGEAVAAWRTTTLAAQLLEETLDDYESHRQPRVLAEASKIFARVTSGRYVELRQAPEGDDIFAVEPNGKTKATAQLSRGTAEQLYLALRLALVRELGTRGVSLPIVMDDVLVNFDPERARSTAQALADVAREQQVLIFSCQPHTARILQEVSEEVAVHELGGPAAQEAISPRRSGRRASAGAVSAASGPSSSSRPSSSDGSRR